MEWIRNHRPTQQLAKSKISNHHYYYHRYFYYYYYYYQVRCQAVGEPGGGPARQDADGAAAGREQVPRNRRQYRAGAQFLLSVSRPCQRGSSARPVRSGAAASVVHCFSAAVRSSSSFSSSSSSSSSSCVVDSRSFHLSRANESPVFPHPRPRLRSPCMFVCLPHYSCLRACKTTCGSASWRPASTSRPSRLPRPPPRRQRRRLPQRLRPRHFSAAAATAAAPRLRPLLRPLRPPTPLPQHTARRTTQHNRLTIRGHTARVVVAAAAALVVVVGGVARLRLSSRRTTAAKARRLPRAAVVAAAGRAAEWHFLGITPTTPLHRPRPRLSRGPRRWRSRQYGRCPWRRRRW